MGAHIGRQHNFDYHIPQLSKFISSEAFKNIFIFIFQESKTGTNVMILQNTSIIVEQSKRRPGLNVKIIGVARVLIIVN